MADYSRLVRRQPGKLGRRTSTAAYGAQPETVMRPNADDVDPRRLPSVLQTLVNEKGELIVSPLRYFEPVQLAEERGDVVEPQA